MYRHLVRFVLILSCLSWASTNFAAEPVRLLPEGTLKESRQPQAAIDAAGNIHVAFGCGNDLYVATSSDAGKTFASPVKVGTPGVLSLGMRRGPRITVTEKMLVVTAIGGPLGKGKDGDLLAWRSTDNGKSWNGPVRVNDEESSAREGLHAMAAGPKGELACAWLDLRTKGSKVFGSTSSDGGQTWSKNFLVYDSPSGAVCPCCHPSITFDPTGNMFVMWRNALEGSRDMYFTQSSDGGKTFSMATKLGQGTWKLDVCPMDGGQIAFSPGGEMFTVWRREQRVFLTGHADSEGTTSTDSRDQSLGQGEQPWLAANAKGAYLAWISKRNGDLFLKPPGTTVNLTVAHEATDPVVATNPTGQGPVIVCWETGPKDKTFILTQVFGAKLRTGSLD